jgi:hypothetical protein
MFVKQRAKHGPDAGLARSVSVFLRIRGVAQQKTHSFGRSDGADSSQIRTTSIDGGEIELEVSRMKDHSLRSVNRDCERMGHRVGHRDELHIEGSDHASLAVAHHHQVGAAQQTGFLDATTGQAEGHRRTEHGEGKFAQQKLQGTNVVLVTVGRHAPHHAVGVLAQPREVRQNEIDAVHVDIGKHQPAVDQQQLVVLLDHHAVATDLPQTTEEDHANRIRHQ